MTDIKKSIIKKYNLCDPNLDDDGLLKELFDFMLELDGDDITTFDADDKVKVTDFIDGIEITNIDDSKRKSCNKFYFNGEFDSNQSVYEQLSNNYKICTVAKTCIIGRALHTFLRIIVDDHHPTNDWIDYIRMMDDYEKNVYTLPEMVNNFKELNNTYCTSYDLHNGAYIEDTLKGYKLKKHINRFFGNVDTWDIYRIACVYGVWGANKRYKKLSI